MLYTVNNGGLPPWGGVIVITFATIIVFFFGYRFVNLYEKWPWIPNLAVFLVIIDRLAKSFWENINYKNWSC
ncbi:hypothetical protein NADFUDRAFT_47772 [Nadsonia fulvescens var. elongata DSM 6958]|uniref:Uncharacterized protein n=1 Tax=Nadsonia fulvescens var. elongata DSM 6958 TaxID=857566 RepID=A0A1E3PF32_9ASCO|nr:hypothetical protein NADFUDRAFT_47772 [Nadsonia fulvescens var. elongata DSM 6958]